MKKTLLVFVALTSLYASAGPLSDSVRQPPWSAYIFVSLKMPTANLVALAQESRKARIPLLINGFDVNGQMKDTQARITELNATCCGKRGGTKWMIYPQKFRQYKIQRVPAFVIASYDRSDKNGFVKVSGDMSLSDALKRIATKSKIAAFRNESTLIYNKAYSNN